MSNAAEAHQEALSKLREIFGTEERSSNGGLVGLQVSAVVHVESSSNRSHPIAGITSQRLLTAGMPNGILFGPRSPRYKTNGNTAP